MKTGIYSLLALAAACVVVSSADAQTPAPAAGPGLHRPMAGGIVDPLEMLARLKDRLGLNTSQQQQFDAAVAQTAASRSAILANRKQLHAALKAQVDTGSPDFDALATQADASQPQDLALRKQTRTAWLALYDTFSAEQKAIVATAIQARWARMQARFGQ